MRVPPLIELPLTVARLLLWLAYILFVVNPARPGIEGRAKGSVARFIPPEGAPRPSVPSEFVRLRVEGAGVDLGAGAGDGTIRSVAPRPRPVRFETERRLDW